MVADQHRRAGRPGLLEPAAAVGQHDRAAAGAGRRTHAVDDRRDALALVVVGAAEEDQQVAVADADRADLAGVAGDRGRGEARQVGGVDLGGRLAQRVDRRQPARAEHQGHVVALDAGQLGEPLGGLAGEVVRGLSCRHAAHSTPDARRRSVQDRRMIDHLGINCSDLAAVGRVLRQGARRPRLHAGSSTSGGASATAPTKPDFWIGRQPADGPASGPNREIHVAFSAGRRRRPRVLRRGRVAGRRGPPRAAALPGVPRPLLRRLRPRPGRQQRRGGLPHRAAGRRPAGLQSR